MAEKLTEEEVKNLRYAHRYDQVFAREVEAARAKGDRAAVRRLTKEALRRAPKAPS